MIAHLINNIKLDNRIRLYNELMEYDIIMTYFTGLRYFISLIDINDQDEKYVFRYNDGKCSIELHDIHIRDNRLDLLYSNMFSHVVIIKNRHYNY